jgi:DNA-binding NarL/FixJ family response regulator
MKKPTVLLADDHKIVLDGLRSLLASRYDLIGAVTNGLELIEQVAARQPDIVVADISMPLLNGIDALAQLHDRNLNPKVVFLTMHPDATYLTRALEAGALGYVIKHAAAEQLLIAIEHALAGQVYISPEMRHSSVTEQLDPTRRHQKAVIALTPRQRQVLQLLAEGKSAKEIGALLDISARTVETHKYKMMDDLGVKTSAQLIQHAIRQGLITVGDP